MRSLLWGMTTRSPAPIGVRAFARLEREAIASVGRQVYQRRLDAGVTQAGLARASGVSQGHLSRIEAGASWPSLDLLLAIGAALGADLSVRFFPGAGPRLHDRFQAPMVDALVSLLDPRWTAEPEVPVLRPVRGVIDLVIYDRAAALAIACEAQSEIRRLEHVIRWSAEKAEALESVERFPASRSRLLLVRSTVATRDLARQFEATLRAAYPARAADAWAALTRPDVAWPGPAILWARVERGSAMILDRPPRGVRLGR